MYQRFLLAEQQAVVGTTGHAECTTVSQSCVEWRAASISQHSANTACPAQEPSGCYPTGVVLSLDTCELELCGGLRSGSINIGATECSMIHGARNSNQKFFVRLKIFVLTHPTRVMLSEKKIMVRSNHSDKPWRVHPKKSEFVLIPGSGLFELWPNPIRHPEIFMQQQACFCSRLQNSS